MAHRTGVILSGTSVLADALGLPLGSRFVFVDASEARSVRFATSYKRLARLGHMGIGAALVDGKIIAAIEVDERANAQGLLLSLAGRSESVLLLGARVVEIGSFSSIGPMTVAFRDEEAQVASVDRLLSELEGYAWTLRRNSQISEERKLP